MWCGIRRRRRHLGPRGMPERAGVSVECRRRRTTGGDVLTAHVGHRDPGLRHDPRRQHGRLGADRCLTTRCRQHVLAFRRPGRRGHVPLGRHTGAGGNSRVGGRSRRRDGPAVRSSQPQRDVVRGNDIVVGERGDDRVRLTGDETGHTGHRDRSTVGRLRRRTEVGDGEVVHDEVGLVAAVGQLAQADPVVAAASGHELLAERRLRPLLADRRGLDLDRVRAGRRPGPTRTARPGHSRSRS